MASVKVTELGGTQEVWKKICRSWISISACIMAWFENKTGLETQTALAGAGRLHIYLGKSGIAGLVGKVRPGVLGKAKSCWKKDWMDPVLVVWHLGTRV